MMALAAKSGAYINRLVLADVFADVL